MVVFPNAKINFGLNIVAKRAEGYHQIESIFYPIGIKDALEISPGKSATTFNAYGLPIPGKTSENLILKAWEILQQRFNLPPVEIDLIKHIPMGGGVGGGSADCGFFINLVNDFFSLKLSVTDRCSLAASLGSDCSFFIENKAAYVTGRGETLDVLPQFLAGYYLVLVYGGMHISTQEAYLGITPKPSETPLYELITESGSWQKKVHNHFEPVVFGKFPELRKIKEELVSCGAVYASLSGTGSCLYGIYKEKPRLTSRLVSICCWQGVL